MVNANLTSANAGEERRTTPVSLDVKVGHVADWINHVLKASDSTHGCQHMVEIEAVRPYPCPMSADVESIVDALVESGRHELVAGVPEGREESLALLRFADLLRRSADRLCHESAMSARNQGASWREVGEAVGGITPQGAEHRFSPAAKERRSKTSKMEWAGKERRAVARQPRVTRGTR
jgi:hypothetical protein